MKTFYILAFFLVSIVATVLASAEDDSVSNVLDKVTLGREQAMDFNKYRRFFWPDIDEECYKECCTREEVEEHYSNRANADMYWNKYVKWRSSRDSHC